MFSDLKKFTFPGIIILFSFTAIILFIISMKFLYRHFNKASLINMESAQSQSIKLDLDDFYLVSKKLGISASPETAATPNTSAE